MIRLLHDSTFAAALYTDRAATLAGLDLSATEIAWLTAPPPAAWRTDAARPARVRAALAEEFPATVVLATAHAAGFLRAPEFHAAIQERGSLALAFGDYLARAPDPRARALARLERAVAAVRRAPTLAASPPGRLRLAARAVVVVVPSGALALLDAVRAGGAPGRLGPDDSPVLVAGVPAGGDVTLEALEPALAALLVRAAEGCAREALLLEARRHGAPLGEDEAIVSGLVADGLLG
jgi:hypothetical protein